MKIRNIEFQRAQLRWVCLLHAAIQTPRQFTPEEHATYGFGLLRPLHQFSALSIAVAFWRSYRNMVGLRRALSSDEASKIHAVNA